MPVNEKEPKSLTFSVSVQEITQELFDKFRDLHTKDLLPFHEARLKFAASVPKLLQQWLDDNQPDLSKLRVTADRLNRLMDAHKTDSPMSRDSHWGELVAVQQQLNELVGCTHPWESLEVAQDDKGLYVLCSRCSKSTRDLKTWVDYDVECGEAQT